MKPTADLSILSLITQSTLVVQLVMLLLAVLSIASWTAIFQKQFSIKRARRETNEFEKQFWGDVFGWKFDTSNPGGYGMTDPTATGIVVGIGEKRGPAGHVTGYVRVADINATAAKAVALGGSVIMPRFSAGPDAWLGVIADAEGHVVGISE